MGNVRLARGEHGHNLILKVVQYWKIDKLFYVNKSCMDECQVTWNEWRAMQERIAGALEP